MSCRCLVDVVRAAGFMIRVFIWHKLKKKGGREGEQKKKEAIDILTVFCEEEENLYSRELHQQTKGDAATTFRETKSCWKFGHFSEYWDDDRQESAFPFWTLFPASKLASFFFFVANNDGIFCGILSQHKLYWKMVPQLFRIAGIPNCLLIPSLYTETNSRIAAFVFSLFLPHPFVQVTNFSCHSAG